MALAHLRATLRTSGNQFLTATDSASAGIFGVGGPIQVSPLAATKFGFSAPTTAAQGTGFTFTVFAEDQFNNTAPTYTGTVVFSSSDAAASLPTPHTLVAGVGVFSATLQTQGGQTLTATDLSNPTITGSTPITVSGVQATHFIFNVPSGATAGAGFAFTVTAETLANTPATTYTGTVLFTSSDGQAVVPAGVTLVNGTGVFSATLKTAGSQTLIATDKTTSSISGVSSPITVSAATANHFAITAPGTATAGTAVSFTVIARDAFNNTAPSYAGTVVFSSTDSGAVFTPGTGTLTAGVGTFTVTLKTSGSQVVSATDTLATSITGVSNTINVSAASATHFVVSAPGLATAGSGFSVTVTARDQFNNTATGYAGNVALTSSDSAATFVPPSGPLTGGVGTFTVTLRTAGPQQVTATDTVTSSITGSSNTITVGAATASHFVVVAPAATNAGASFGFTVTAEDPFNNVATGYVGQVGFSSSDVNPSTSLPANSVLTNGVGTFNATLTTAGNQTIVATDTATSSITGSSGTITVSAAATTRFNVVAPGTATAGVPITFTVTAQDKFGNVVTTYSTGTPAGTAVFSSTDSAATFVPPGNVGGTLTNGVGIFSATLRTAGNETIKAADFSLSGINGTSNTILVSGSTASHLVVTAPAGATAGAGFSFTVTAEDQFNNTATGYNGTVAFASTDSAAGVVLPPNSVLTNSVGVFSATLITVGTQFITATDTTTSSITGTSAAINVNPGAASHFVVVVPSAATAGVSVLFTVTAEDRFNNTATGYTGTTVFKSTDSTAVFAPLNVQLTSGVGVFNATLKIAGTQTITASDSVVSSVNGVSGPITVSAAAATHFLVAAPSPVLFNTSFPFTVTAEDPFNNVAPTYAGTIHFAATDTSVGVLVPADTTLTNGVGVFNATLQAVGKTATITATDTVNASISGKSNSIVITASAAASFSVVGPASTTAGTVGVYTVMALSSGGTVATNYTGTVVFSSSDLAATFAPVQETLINGVGTFSVTLKTAGSQTVIASDKTVSSITGSTTTTVSASVTTHIAISASVLGDGGQRI